MCGIAGVLGGQESGLSEEELAEPLRTLRHRGPDADGWTALTLDARLVRHDIAQTNGIPPPRNVAALLLHRRLSILDLTPSGTQPMATADDRHHLVFNGEIYNYLELRAELSREGRRFRSGSDTEVLLEALAHWGPAALGRLVGMFAFALLDTQRRTLFLARDVFGIKPLYYVATEGTFAFASEIKSLLRLPTVRRNVDPQRLFEYLRFGRTDHGDRTMFADIRQLPAAHHLTVSLDGPGGVPQVDEPVRYWNLDLRERIDVSFDEAASRVRELFLDSIRLHLRSDVPVGAALSGGIDSSAILAGMRAIEPRAELHAFSYIADDPAVSEERWVDVMGAATGTILHKVRASADELIADLDDLIYTQDEPFGSTSMYAQFRVFRLARASGITVMLDGQGADEMLAGYRPYLAARLASLVRQGKWTAAFAFARQARRVPGGPRLSRLLFQAAKAFAPASGKRLAHGLLGPLTMPAWLDRGWFRARGVTVPGIPDTGIDRPDILREQLRETLFETSVPMLLRYEDRNSMAASVESRVPFLTPALAEYLLRLPEEYLLAADGTSKHVFRQAMRGIVPDPILDRRDKIGFATPELRWLTALRPWVEATLTSSRARDLAPIRLPAMLEEWRQVVAGRRPFDFRIWRWVNFIRWAERFDVTI